MSVSESVATNLGLEDSYAKYVPFLAEIRKRLLFTVSVFLIFGGLGFFYYERVIAWALTMFSLDGLNIVFTSPFQFVNLALASGFLIGIVVVFPLLLFQVFSFLKPALSAKEFRTMLALLPLNIILFVMGFGFGIVVMRMVVTMFYQKSVELQIGNILDISLLLSQIMMTSTLMGAAFQFPIVLTVLIRLKVVTYHQIESKRIIAYIASLIFAILLPPTDLLSMFLLFLPLALLFELTLILNRWVLKAHRR
jgi:sec-independent protein translocase protein TatC